LGKRLLLSPFAIMEANVKSEFTSYGRTVIAAVTGLSAAEKLQIDPDFMFHSTSCFDAQVIRDEATSRRSTHVQERGRPLQQKVPRSDSRRGTERQ
jgi:hypothetical protein